MSTSGGFDVAVIGAGAAGLAAGVRLHAAGARVVVLEAKDRVGGRAHTLAGRDGAALDLGCGWLHSARENAFTAMVEPRGFTLDQSPAAWSKPGLSINFPLEQQHAFRQAFQAFEERLEAAADEAFDHPASDFFDSVEPRWIPLLNAFSGYYNGAPFDEISVKDYAAYQPTAENWRVREGYGALIASLADGLDVRLSTPVSRVEHGGPGVRLVAAAGVVEARAAIVAVPTTVLAEGRIAFDPPLPAKLEAADNLPLGHVEKAFLQLLAPEEFQIESMVRGRIDSAETGGYTFRPMGMPVIEGFFGGDLAEALELESPGAVCDFAMGELVAVFGSDLRRRVRPIAESRWRTDSFIRGAYSHARVGHADARAVLAEPVDDRLFFAGEACSPHAFSTAHGAHDTGVIAAEAALTALGFNLRPS